MSIYWEARLKKSPFWAHVFIGQVVEALRTISDNGLFFLFYFLFIPGRIFISVPLDLIATCYCFCFSAFVHRLHHRMAGLDWVCWIGWIWLFHDMIPRTTFEAIIDYKFHHHDLL